MELKTVQENEDQSSKWDTVYTVYVFLLPGVPFELSIVYILLSREKKFFQLNSIMEISKQIQMDLGPLGCDVVLRSLFAVILLSNLVKII